MDILKEINEHGDLAALPAKDIPALCQELRDFLVEKVSRTGGHLASSLGAVELTVALHRVYDPMRDRILFDVGHQAYVHKILTGRRDGFDSLRCLDGLAGFPKPCESNADPIIAGHASDSISAGLGMARARTLQGEDYDVVVVIGDGAMTGGVSFEGLSDAGTSGESIVIILNDNGMSINRSVGGIARIISRARRQPGYIHFKQRYRRVTKNLPGLYKLTHRLKEAIRNRLMPPGIFDTMGFFCIGPIDGHNEQELEKTIRWARELHRPVLIHAVTVKGKGYAPAEKTPELFHGVGPFDAETGIVPPPAEDFSARFGRRLTELADQDETICAVTAAMESGTGLASFAEAYPRRFFELGIAEEHAAALCAGMAKQGLKPVFAVYSTFLQRSYDMLLENIGLMKLHVVLAVDRAGLVGHDGVTHHGSFDIAFLTTVPGMKIYAPASYAELETMLETALLRETGPVAIRYPRGGEGTYREDRAGEEASLLRAGSDVSIVCHGITVNYALAAAEKLAAQGVSCEIIKLNRICPLPTELCLSSLRRTGRFVMVEDACRVGSVGTQLLAACGSAGVLLRGVRQLDLGRGVVSHGSVAELHHRLKIDTDGIISAVTEIMDEESKTGSDHI